jgi:hypothetical protein
VEAFWSVVGVLGVWRITHLLHAEDGPWDIVVKLRRSAGTGMTGELLDCFYCLSLWVAVPFACLVGHGWTARLLLWPALSGGAIMLERVTARDAPAPAAAWVEHSGHEEVDDALLRERDAAVRRAGAGERDP